MPRQIWIASIFASALTVVGCESGPRYLPVKGDVSFNGKPVENGLVQFEPVDATTPSAKGGAIVNGKYAAELLPGDWLVRITAVRGDGKMRKVYEDAPDSPVKEGSEQYLPKRCNIESSNFVKIDTKRNDLHFHLKTD